MLKEKYCLWLSRKVGTSQLSGLIFELNRCMPNSRYGDERGAACQPLSIGAL